MAKPFPESIVLKTQKCPACGDKMHAPKLQHHQDGVIRAACKKEGCKFSLDVFWLGDPSSRQN